MLMAAPAPLPVLNYVEHELVVQQSDKVEGAEAGGGAKGEVSDDHGGVEAPAEEELPGTAGELDPVQAGGEQGVHHALQPASPGLQ